CTERMALHNLC
nr:Chain B, OS1 peptide [synthetic construct]